ncbi:hypothetical protein JTB14_003774 [Gonioctena quinquepunctata]|nr:hypothetical protein JTB14_003774 [Gonioctena quinquepunctata]
MFQVPDELLDILVCDSCHKYLSVGPVKVYRDKATKCGRCSANEDGGVISQYGHIAEHGLFKCVNRFDGCRQLLTYTQVAEHESSCKSKKYVCPICPGNTEVPTFLLVRHFREFHSDCYLKTPSFSLKLCEVNAKTYLYKEKDQLFFVKYRNTSKDTICLNIFCLGGQEKADRIKQKFIVYHGIQKLKTTSKCVAFGYDAPEEELLLTKPEGDIACVVFELDLSEALDIFRFPVPKVIEQMSQKDKCLPSAKKLGLPRNVSMSQSSGNTGNNFDLGCVMLKNDIKLQLYCYHCYSAVEKGKLFQVTPAVYQGICEICETYYKLHSKIKLITTNELKLPLENPIFYSCLWGCSVMNRFDEIESHELMCPYQPTQACPVPQCTQKGQLLDLARHFEKMHPEEQMILNAEVSILKPFPSDCRKFYVWVQEAFIIVQLNYVVFSSFLGKQSYSLNILPCSANNAMKLEPIGQIFLSDNPLKHNSILITIEDSFDFYYDDPDLLLKFCFRNE